MMAVIICGLALTTTTTGAEPAVCQDSRAPLLCETNHLRQQVWKLERTMGRPLTRTSFSDRRSPSRAYREWVHHLWEARVEKLSVAYERWLAAEGEVLAAINAAWPRYDEWVRIGVCESGHNPPNWQHNSGTYQGALGFYWGSWDAYEAGEVPGFSWSYKDLGFPADADDATPLQQMVVAERIFDDHGLSGWGCRGAAG